MRFVLFGRTIKGNLRESRREVSGTIDFSVLRFLMNLVRKLKTTKEEAIGF